MHISSWYNCWIDNSVIFIHYFYHLFLRVQKSEKFMCIMWFFPTLVKRSKYPMWKSKEFSNDKNFWLVFNNKREKHRKKEGKKQRTLKKTLNENQLFLFLAFSFEQRINNGRNMTCYFGNKVGKRPNHFKRPSFRCFW